MTNRPDMDPSLRQESSVLLDGPDRAAARAMLRGIGLTDDDFSRPLIGIANTWTEIGPCNYSLRQLSAKVKEGIRAAGATPLEFNTIAVSDGISMGTAFQAYYYLEGKGLIESRPKSGYYVRFNQKRFPALPAAIIDSAIVHG